jgi:hypothetical protein
MEIRVRVLERVVGLADFRRMKEGAIAGFISAAL